MFQKDFKRYKDWRYWWQSASDSMIICWEHECPLADLYDRWQTLLASGDIKEYTCIEHITALNLSFSCFAPLEFYGLALGLGTKTIFDDRAISSEQIIECFIIEWSYDSLRACFFWTFESVVIDTKGFSQRLSTKNPMCCVFVCIARWYLSFWCVTMLQRPVAF